MLLITETSMLPLTIATLKDYWHIEFDDDDSQILRCLRAGINDVEHATGRDIIERQWEQEFPCFLSSMTLDRSPLKQVDSITYTDADGTSQAFTDYKVSNKTFARPIVKPDEISSGSEVKITYTTGFDEVSPTVEQAILWAAGLFYFNREAEVIGTITSPLKLG